MASAEFHSIVVPIYNEEDVLRELHARLSSALSVLPAYEVILVDDGSSDATAAMLAEISAGDARWKCVSLARNFGQQTAMTAGIDFARGDTVTVIDADLQDPPELIPRMVEEWRRGADVVFAVRESRRGERWFKRACASAYYRVLRALTSVDIPADHSEFRLISRRVAAALRGMGERNRYTRGLAAWVGLKRVTILYPREPRRGGATKYSVLGLIGVASDGILSFSVRPLRLATALGFFASFLALAYGIFALVYWYVTRAPVAGWTSLVIIVLFLGGVQLVTLGVVGEYIGRIYDEVRARPLYTVAGVSGFGAAVDSRFRDSCLPDGRELPEHRGP